MPPVPAYPSHTKTYLKRKRPLGIVVLQHPRETKRDDAEISSAPVIEQVCKTQGYPFALKTGLSWRNLGHALKGTLFETDEYWKDPKTWGVLYLGTQKQSSASNGQSSPSSSKPALSPGLYFLNQKGGLHQEPPPASSLFGIIALDGTWSQSKTLWWRNSWLLKCRRIMIVPERKSLYGNRRKEPRPECVSTCEAVAAAVNAITVDKFFETEALNQFQVLIEQNGARL